MILKVFTTTTESIKSNCISAILSLGKLPFIERKVLTLIKVEMATIAATSISTITIQPGRSSFNAYSSSGPSDHPRYLYASMLGTSESTPHSVTFVQTKWSWANLMTSKARYYRVDEDRLCLCHPHSKNPMHRRKSLDLVKVLATTTSRLCHYNLSIQLTWEDYPLEEVWLVP